MTRKNVIKLISHARRMKVMTNDREKNTQEKLSWIRFIGIVFDFIFLFLMLLNDGILNISFKETVFTGKTNGILKNFIKIKFAFNIFRLNVQNIFFYSV